MHFEFLWVVCHPIPVLEPTISVTGSKSFTVSDCYLRLVMSSREKLLWKFDQMQYRFSGVIRRLDFVIFIHYFFGTFMKTLSIRDAFFSQLKTILLEFITQSFTTFT